MPSIAAREEISVSQLLLDLINPRLLDSLESQREAVRAMLEAQGKKIVKLAENITIDGINPADSFIAMPDGEDPNKYIVGTTFI